MNIKQKVLILIQDAILNNENVILQFKRDEMLIMNSFSNSDLKNLRKNLMKKISDDGYYEKFNMQLVAYSSFDWRKRDEQL